MTRPAPDVTPPDVTHPDSSRPDFASADFTPADFSHVEHWVFDLDNTLYPSKCNLFAEIDARMTDFVARALVLPHGEARALQKRYYAEYGTTLSGLMKVNGLKPDHYLDYVHDIDLSPLDGVPDLAPALLKLPGKRYVFTNASMRHAENVTKRLGIDHLFNDVFDLAAANYAPKPTLEAFERFFETTGADPKRSAMFEDIARNLMPAHQRGMTTVLVRSSRDWGPAPDPAGGHDHVHYVADDLCEFLGRLSFNPVGGR